MESIERSNNNSTYQCKYYTKDTIHVSVSAPSFNASFVKFTCHFTGIFYLYLTNECLYYSISPSVNISLVILKLINIKHYIM